MITPTFRFPSLTPAARSEADNRTVLQSLSLKVSLVALAVFFFIAAITTFIFPNICSLIKLPISSESCSNILLALSKLAILVCNCLPETPRNPRPPINPPLLVRTLPISQSSTATQTSVSLTPRESSRAVPGQISDFPILLSPPSRPQRTPDNQISDFPSSPVLQRTFARLDASPFLSAPFTYIGTQLSFSDERYSSLCAHENKNLFPHFFNKLSETSDFKNNPHLFINRVQEILELAEKHPDVFYIHLSQTLESCSDRTAHELDNIECALRVASCHEMPLENLAQFLLKCHRLHRLNTYVAKECENDHDAIETSLALRILFQSDLPTRTQFMRYDALSEAPLHFAKARQYIFEDNLTIEMKASVLCQNEYWTNQLSQDEIFQKDLEKLSDNLSSFSANDAEFLTAAERAEKSYKTLQIHHTIRLLNSL